VYKKITALLFLLFLLMLLFPSPAEAATTCTTTSSVVDSFTYKEYEEQGGQVTSGYESPTKPVLKNHAHDRDLVTSDFTSSTYVRNYYIKYYSRDVTVSDMKYVKKCSDGSTTTTYDTKTTYGSWTFVRNNPYDETLPATVTVTQSGGSAKDGYKSFTAKAAGGGGKTTSSLDNRSYFVNKMTVTVSKGVTYEEDKFPTVACTKYYGFGVGDGHSEDCTKDVTVGSDDNKTTIRNICYTYEENGNSDIACTSRIYVKSLEVTGPSTVYTGQHHTFRCKATYYDNSSWYVDEYPEVMSSAPYSYIGTDWYNTGYKKPQGGISKPNGVNDFYSADNESKDYTIKCSYYPDSYGDEKGVLVKDTTKEKTATKKVKHVGIKDIVVDASGYFPTGANEYKFISKVDKTQESRGNFTGVKFITGHWYDFTATLIYDDGTKRDVTSAPEVFWTSYPWYNGVDAYDKAHSYDSGMTATGLGHRIPADGENTIMAEYFNRNVPYGGNSSGNYDNSYPSRGWTKLDSRQISKLDIRGKSSYSTAPITSVNAGDEVQYSAWVTWTDGTKEDWTNFVNWSGDYLLENGLYNFYFAGNNNKATVTASFNDVDLIEKAGDIDHWDSTTDTVEVTIMYDCTKATTLISGCSVPKGNWQTEPSKFFESKNTNFLPPPTAFGFEGSSWKNSDGSYRDEYPYNFNFKFNVSGVSEGNGRN